MSAESNDPPRRRTTEEVMQWFRALPKAGAPAHAVGDEVAGERGNGGEPLADAPPEHEGAAHDPAEPGASTRSLRVLSARAIVTYELAQWPSRDPSALLQSVVRLAGQGRQLGVPVETMIVEMRQLVDKHLGDRLDTSAVREVRDRLVTELITAYFKDR